MTVEELAKILNNLVESGMGKHEVADDDGEDISEVAVVMNGKTTLVVVR